MSYFREIPRDLFNEADLLKCMGRLIINANQHTDKITIEHFNKKDQFDIRQDPADGDIYVENINVFVNDNKIKLHRTLNAREPYSLIMITEDDDNIPVFTPNGEFSDEFKHFIETGELTH